MLILALDVLDPEADHDATFVHVCPLIDLFNVAVNPAVLLLDDGLKEALHTILSD